MSAPGIILPLPGLKPQRRLFVEADEIVEEGCVARLCLWRSCVALYRHSKTVKRLTSVLLRNSLMVGKDRRRPINRYWNACARNTTSGIC